LNSDADTLAKACEISQQSKASLAENPQNEGFYPRIFDKALMDDMRSALLLLEQRVQEGPGGLSKEEVDQVCGQLDRIQEEIVRNKDQPRPSRPIESDSSSGSASSSLAASVSTSVAPGNQSTISPPTQSTSAASAIPTPAASVLPAPTQSSVPTQPSPSQVASAPASASLSLVASPYTIAAKQQPVTDTSLDEGPMYDGTGGMGQPRGTLSTYYMPGMEALSPEEYQKALQQSIIDRQRARRETNYQGTGNRATWNYPNNLSGDRGVLKKDEMEKNTDDGASDEQK
jgi:hypothetical protein